MVTVLVASRTVPPLAMSEYAFALAWPLRGQDRQQSGRQGRLAVVDVPDRADVDVRLSSGECFLGHVFSAFSAFLKSSLRRAIRSKPHPPARSILGRLCQRPGPTAAHVFHHARTLGNRPKSCRWDLNPGPRPYQGRALPTEPRQRNFADASSSRSVVALRRGRLGDAGQERVMGIEPTRPAWKAGTLPLSYTRVRVSFTRLKPPRLRPSPAGFRSLACFDPRRPCRRPPSPHRPARADARSRFPDSQRDECGWSRIRTCEG